MRVLLGCLLVLLIAVVALAAWLYSGSYDLSAREPRPWVANLTELAKRQSVRAHAQHIDTPPLTDAVMVEEGARRYRDACVQCHGAPGVEPQPFARAMWPAPPNLTKPAGWTPSQLFWIVQNGLKRSGMPAYQPGMTNEEIWSVVAVLEQMPQMDSARWHRLSTPPAPPPEAAPAGQDIVPPAEEETETPEPAPATPAPGQEPPAEGAPPSR